MNAKRKCIHPDEIAWIYRDHNWAKLLVLSEFLKTLQAP